MHIARDGLRIQPQFGRAEDQLGLAEIAAQSETRLPQEVASVFAVVLGPEEGNQLVAADAILVRRREQGEESERLTSHGSAPTGRAVFLNRQAAKRPELQHCASFNASLTQSLTPPP